MIKLYFKQAWQLLKQNPLFSSVYVLGTGLGIAMTMSLVIIYYIKMAPVYPEENRNRILVSKGMTAIEQGNENNSRNIKGNSANFNTPQHKPQGHNEKQGKIRRIQ